MFNDALQKLRTVTIKAYSKIVLRSEDKRPGKWQSDAYTDDKRDWTKLSLGFLYNKLDEEARELVQAIEHKLPLQEVLAEAGDVTAIAMFLADKAGCLKGSALQPTVVCLCGSTKFKDEFQRQNFLETMKGNIVLTVGFYGHADKEVYLLRDEEKIFLDDLHKRKIDLADEVLVINPKGYIGDSTHSEIDYALKTGKVVRYLETPKPKLEQSQQDKSEAQTS